MRAGVLKKNLEGKVSYSPSRSSRECLYCCVEDCPMDCDGINWSLDEDEEEEGDDLCLFDGYEEDDLNYDT